MGTILKNLYVVYLHRTRDLNDGLVQKAVEITLITRKSSDIDQNSDVTPEPVQHILVACFGQRFIHNSPTSPLLKGAKDP